MDLMQELRFQFSSKGQGGATFYVVEFNGSESLSSLFRFELTLVSSDANVDFDAMLKSKATLTITSSDGSEKVPYHGILCEFEQLAQKNNYVFYKAVLVPRLWALSLYACNEVFVAEQTIPEIITSILQKNNLTNNDYSLSLKDPGAYRKRSFVCQYEESNLDFIDRSMQYLGIYYYFEHSTFEGGTEKLQITDFKESHPASSISLTYCNLEDLSTNLENACVYNLSVRQKPVPKSVTVQDFNYRNAALGDNLKASAEVDAKGSGDLMYFGGNLRTVHNAQQLATVRAQAIECGKLTFSGDSTAVGIRVGHHISICGHYRDAVNTKYMVTRVKHFGTQAGVLLDGEASDYTNEQRGTTYTASFEAIPASTQFRPQRLTPIPVISGVLSAIIDAEGTGNFAELNQYGQYKVQLVYDKSPKSATKGSCYVRMATDYSGSHNGSHFPLIKGTEVLLAFMGGDPDQPVIVGAVPNSENYNVVNNGIQTNNRILTNGGNQIVMNDQTGRQMISISSPNGSTSITIGSIPLRSAP